jgi:hypothetical protein
MKYGGDIYVDLSWKEILIAYARFEVFTAVTMKTGVVWDV